MATLVDLMTVEAPTRVELTGKRLAGSVEVTYARSSHLTPVLRFGSDRFGVHTSVVTANGIECEVAGVTFHRRPEGEWAGDTYRNVRRNIDYKAGGHMEWEAPYKTVKMIEDALAVMCPGLWERFPDAFLARLGTGNDYADGDEFVRARTRARNDLRIVEAFAELGELVASGQAIVVNRHDELPDEIRWEYPSRDTMANHDIQKGRGRVVGTVIGNDCHTGLLGIAIDRGDPHRPDTYHGPLLVPLEMANTL